MEACFKKTWDYLGWKNKKYSENSVTQDDWNQTLLTQMNLVSTNIHQATLRGSANIARMHPKAFMIIKTLEYYWEDTNTISGRYKVEIDDKLPSDKIYMINEDKVAKELKAKDSELVLCLHKKFSQDSPSIGEFTIQVLRKNTDLYKEALNDINKVILDGPMMVGEITIINHHTLDPETGELLVDYHTEISEDIWISTPTVDISETDILQHRQASLLENSKILSSGPNQTPKKTFIVSVGKSKPWYKKLLDLFKNKN